MRNDLHYRLRHASITGTDLTMEGPEAADLEKLISTGMEVLNSIGSHEYRNKLQEHVNALMEFRTRYLA